MIPSIARYNVKWILLEKTMSYSCSAGVLSLCNIKVTLNNVFIAMATPNKAIINNNNKIGIIFIFVFHENCR